MKPDTHMNGGGRVELVEQQHLAWIARSLGRAHYMPLHQADVQLLSKVGEPISKYPGTHLFKEGEEAASTYLVQSGEVELYRVAEDTKPEVARVGAG